MIHIEIEWLNKKINTMNTYSADNKITAHDEESATKLTIIPLHVQHNTFEIDDTKD